MTLSSVHHSFDINLAMIYGMTEAILIHHFQHWIGVNKRLQRNSHEGRTWSYQTIDEICAHFPYLSKEDVRGALERLCNGKSRRQKSAEPDFEPVLIKGNFNKTPFDRTVWYAFSNSVYERVNSQMDQGIVPNPIGYPPTPIPDTIPDTKTKKKNTEPSVAPSAIATDSTQALLLSIRKYKPDFKDPNIKAWNEEMDFLLRLDNRSIADVKKVIDWVSSSVFWRKIILSPKNLRKNFDRLQLEMMDSKQSMETINRNLADKMKLLYPMQVACGEIQISEEYIELGKGSRVQEFRFSDKNFYPSVRDFLRSMMLPIHEFN